jgi:hypothetical protein
MATQEKRKTVDRLADELREALLIPTAHRYDDWVNLTIVVLDIHAGKNVLVTQAFRRPDEVEQFIEEIKKLALPPKEFLEQASVFCLAEDGTVGFRATARQVLDKRILGGRKPQPDYDEIADRIQNEGTKAAYNREYDAWVAENHGNEQVPKTPRKAFYKNMYRRGIRYRQLK